MKNPFVSMEFACHDFQIHESQSQGVAISIHVILASWKLKDPDTLVILYVLFDDY